MLSEISIIFPAFLAGLFVLLVHVPLGIEVVKRGIIFIDLSIAQLAAMGAFFASLAVHSHGHGHIHLEDFLFIQVSAFVCAVLGGLLFMYVEKKHKNIEETVIGCVFVLSATLILLALSQNPHGGEHLKELLAGQLLFVSYEHILWSAMVLAVVLVLYVKFHKRVMEKYFYIIFAVTITITVQMAGIYLVFATLIFPALGTYYIKQYKSKLIVGYIGGFIGLVLGLFSALMFDLTTGPAVVWTIALIMLGILCIKNK